MRQPALPSTTACQLPFYSLEGRYRRLSPEETERLNGFPAGWTDIEGIKPSRRGFLMGNALVVGIISRLRGPLRELIEKRGE